MSLVYLYKTECEKLLCLSFTVLYASLIFKTFEKCIYFNQLNNHHFVCFLHYRRYQRYFKNIICKGLSVCHLRKFSGRVILFKLLKMLSSKIISTSTSLSELLSFKAEAYKYSVFVFLEFINLKLIKHFQTFYFK